MMKSLTAGSCLLLSFCLPVQADFKADEKGLTFSGDNYSVNFGALLQYDIMHANADKTPLKDGNDWRGQQVFIRGTIGDSWAFKYNYDFKSQSHKDGWLQYKPFAISAGQFKSPVGMENQQSSRWFFFNEVSMMSSIAPQRFIGIKWQPVLGDQMLLAAAVQQANINDEHSMNDEPLRTSIRFVYSPVHQPGNVAHLGASGQFVNYKDARRSLQIGVVPEAKIEGMPKIISSGKLKVESSQVGGLEAAFSRGPLALTSEFMYHHIRTTEYKSYHFHGGYVQASYFLDNETSRTYNMANGVFDKPSSTNLTWELAVRASQMDLEDRDIKGGIQTNYTAGINFHVNTNLKLMLDYIDSHTKDGPKGDEHAGIAVLRTQIAF